MCKNKINTVSLLVLVVKKNLVSSLYLNCFWGTRFKRVQIIRHIEVVSIVNNKYSIAIDENSPTISRAYD